ncbi:hypothetical protein SVIOM74S_08233 [Streptomyces violarus]
MGGRRRRVRGAGRVPHLRRCAGHRRGHATAPAGEGGRRSAAGPTAGANLPRGDLRDAGGGPGGYAGRGHPGRGGAGVRHAVHGGRGHRRGTDDRRGVHRRGRLRASRATLSARGHRGVGRHRGGGEAGSAGPGRARRPHAGAAGPRRIPYRPPAEAARLHAGRARAARWRAAGRMGAAGPARALRIRLGAHGPGESAAGAASPGPFRGPAVRRPGSRLGRTASASPAARGGPSLGAAGDACAARGRPDSGVPLVRGRPRAGQTSRPGRVSAVGRGGRPLRRQWVFCRGEPAAASCGYGYGGAPRPGPSARRLLPRLRALGLGRAVPGGRSAAACHGAGPDLASRCRPGQAPHPLLHLRDRAGAAPGTGRAGRATSRGQRRRSPLRGGTRRGTGHLPAADGGRRRGPGGRLVRARAARQENRRQGGQRRPLPGVQHRQQHPVPRYGAGGTGLGHRHPALHGRGHRAGTGGTQDTAVQRLHAGRRAPRRIRRQRLVQVLAEVAARAQPRRLRDRDRAQRSDRQRTRLGGRPRGAGRRRSTGSARRAGCRPGAVGARHRGRPYLAADR